jgi:hypothetical protein
VVTTLPGISHNPEPNPGSTPQYQGPKDAITTIFVQTTIVDEDILSDQDWNRDLHEALTFDVVGHTVISHLVPTLSQILM